MKKLNNSGLAAVLIVLLTLAAVGIGFAGYRVYKNSQDEPKTEDGKQTVEVAPEKKEEKKQETPKEDRKIITFNGATYSFALPAGWQHKETFGYPGPESNEKIVQITDPSNQYQLDIQTIDYAGSVSEGNTPEASFSGIGGKIYYLEGYQGTAAKDFETVFISACETKHCMTPINDTYELNLSITRTPDNYSDGVAINAAEVEVIKQIVASIKIGG